VRVFDQAGDHQKAVATLRNGLSQPTGVAVDANGDVYVANLGSSTVSVFHEGQKSPYRTLTGATTPWGIAVDGLGNVYCVNTNSNVINVFAPGSQTPTSTLTAHFPPSDLAFYVAVDAKGDVFVNSYSTGEIDEFPGGSTTPVVLRTVSGPSSLAVDSNENLIVGSGYPPGSIFVYAPPYTGAPIHKKTFTHQKPITAIALSADNSALWFTERTLPPAHPHATQLTYPNFHDVESITRRGWGYYGFQNGIALSPTPPL
jgi:sugar lactone lactonase YvrE